MRFATKFDRWLVTVLALTVILTAGVIPVVAFTAPGKGMAPWWLALTPLAIWAIVIPATLPQYYEVRPDGLFIRQGWRRALIPWVSLIEIRHLMSDLRSAGVYSADRLVVVTRESKRFPISVAERERFLAEVSRRCPQLQQEPFGLALPLAPPTIV